LLDDEWDPSNSIFSEMDYSSFVSQRLKEVNEQWDKEPLPDENLRHKSIEFKKVVNPVNDLITFPIFIP